MLYLVNSRVYTLDTNEYVEQMCGVLSGCVPVDNGSQGEQSRERSFNSNKEVRVCYPKGSVLWQSLWIYLKLYQRSIGRGGVGGRHRWISNGPESTITAVSSDGSEVAGLE